MTREEVIEFDNSIQIVSAVGGIFLFYSPAEDNEWRDQLDVEGDETINYYIDFCKKNNLTMFYFSTELNPVTHDKMLETYNHQIAEAGVICPFEVVGKMKDYYMSLIEHGFISKDNEE